MAVDPVTEVTGFTVTLSKDEAKRLYRDIEDILASVGVLSAKSRENYDAPQIYALYDGLYVAGVTDAD